MPELKFIDYLDFSATAISCLPNYGTVNTSIPLLGTLPLCDLFNPNGCSPYGDINGKCYYDLDSDCIFQNIDAPTNYAKVQLYYAGSLVRQTYTGNEGFYSIDTLPGGMYTLQIDTSSLPFTVICPATNAYTLNHAGPDSVFYDRNFSLKCRTEGFDIGVRSVLATGIIRPGNTFTLKTTAGDISQLFGARCASGIGGQVQMS